MHIDLCDQRNNGERPSKNMTQILEQLAPKHSKYICKFLNHIQRLHTHSLSAQAIAPGWWIIGLHPYDREAIMGHFLGWSTSEWSKERKEELFQKFVPLARIGYDHGHI